MNRKTFAVLPGVFALLALAACAPSAKSTSAPSSNAATSSEAPMHGKQQAPVVVDAQLEGTSARVTVRFDAPATDVRVSVHGLDGLTVTSPPTLADGVNFPQATTATYDVAFTPGAGRSHLVVSVSGAFPGGQRTRVASFAIGTPTDAQRSSHATKAEGAHGERIKVMPAEQN